MNDPRRPTVLEQIAPLTGIGATVMLFVTVIDVGPPPPISRTVDVGPHFAQHGDAMVIEAVLLGFAWLFFLWFAASLKARLRVNEPDPGRLSSIAFASAAVASALGTGAAATLAATAALAPQEMTFGFLLLHLGRMLSIFIAFPAAAMILAASLSALRYGGLPKMLAQAGVLLSVLSVVAAIALPNNPDLVNGVAMSGLLFMGWVSWVSIVLYAGRSSAPNA